MNNIKLYAIISNKEQQETAPTPKHPKHTKHTKHPKHIENIDDIVSVIDKKSTESGYQGYAYENKLNGDIIVVHCGSEPLKLGANKSEMNKDWVQTDLKLFVSKSIPEQFYDSSEAG